MKNRRNNDRKNSRRPAKAVKKRILVITEGKKTEPQYLEQFTEKVDNPLVEIVIARGQGVPKSLVEKGKELRQIAADRASRENDDNLSFDSVWCVFDRDEHPNVPEALLLAKDSGLEIAYSNPCFELWLLLHFREPPGMRDRHALQELIKQFVPKYDKSIHFDRDYATGYLEAVKRAEQLDVAAERDNDLHRNPTTGVWRLTESIRNSA